MSKKAGSRSDSGGLVYSTDAGKHCPVCRQPIDACRCAVETPKGDGIARVRRETKGRGGKTVTTIAGLALSGEDIQVLAKDLKRRCGTGGSVKDGVIEIQGDHVDLLLDVLKVKGFTAKKTGG